MNFDKLKKARKTSVADLAAKLDKMGGGGYKEDERLWNPTFDKKEGKGYAVVRFLPAPGEEEDAFVKQYTHNFKGSSGQWYNEKSLTTLGEDDPVGELNRVLWNADGDDDNSPSRKQARKQKRTLKYYANVLIVQDPANSENEGKVFLYKFGPQLMKCVERAVKPEFEDEAPFDPTCMWEGANFKIKMTGREMPDGKGGKVTVPNYEQSVFDSQSELFPGDDDKKKEVWESTHSLFEFVDPEKFKSYDELKKRLDSVLGNKTDAAQSAAEQMDEEVKDMTAPSNDAPVEKEAADPAPAEESSGEDQDIEDFFKSL